MYELAEVLEGLDSKDGALHGYRRVFEAARAMGAGDEAMPGFGEQTAAQVQTDCLARIEKLDRNVHKAMLESDAALIAGIKESAKTYKEAGFPRSALHMLATARAIVGGSAELAALSDEIRTETGIDVRRWRRLPVEEGLELWEKDDGWSAKDAAIHVRTANLVLATCRNEMPETYRYEVAVLPADQGDFPVYGLVFGSNSATGAQLFAILPKAGSTGLVRFEEGAPKITHSFAIPRGKETKEGQPQRLAVEVGPGWVELFIDDQKVGKVDVPPHELRGQVGLFAQKMKASFSDLRILY
jgi:hypothetical protein